MNADTIRAAFLGIATRAHQHDVPIEVIIQAVGATVIDLSKGVKAVYPTLTTHEVQNRVRCNLETGAKHRMAADGL